MEIGVDLPGGIVGEGDERIDLLGIGVDALVLGSKFGGPRTQDDIAGLDLEADSVEGDNLVAWELDLRRVAQDTAGVCGDSDRFLQDGLEATRAAPWMFAAALEVGVGERVGEVLFRIIEEVDQDFFLRWSQKTKLLRH